VGLHLLQAAWSASSLTWSTSPLLDPAAPAEAHTLSWDATNPSSYWIPWHLSGAIEGAIGSTGLLDAGFASTNENANGWVYFAKKEWELDKAPCVLYCYEGGSAPNAPSDVSHSQNGPVHTISWSDNSSDEDGFWIEFKDEYGVWNQVGQVPADTTSFTHQHTIHGFGDSWWAAYRVRAVKNTGRWSAWASWSGLVE
jgi:hypothetical protein